MKLKRVIAALVAASAVFICAACASPYGNGAGSEVRGNYFAFALGLLKGAAGTGNGKENTMISPYSAAACLALVANGAKNETLTQIETALGADSETLNNDVKALEAAMKGYTSQKLKSSNSAWLKKGFPVLPDYTGKIKEYMSAAVYERSFDSSTVKEINDSVSRDTDGMINEIIKELPPDAVCVLVNALLFDAKWAEKFPDSHKGDFKGDDGTLKEADFMYAEEKTYISGKNYTGFRKDYEGGKTSFVALLPDDAGDIDAFIKSLDGGELSRSVRGRSEKVDVKVPVFGFDNEFELNGILASLGMKDAFDPEKADFSAMSEKEIYLSLVIQKTHIELGSEGTKAAAVTAAMYEATASPGLNIELPKKQVYLDRPFVFIIMDNDSTMPLFMGAVRMP